MNSTVFAIMGVFLLLLIITGRLERRMVWPYGEPEPFPRYGDLDGYGARAIADGANLGCRFVGWCQDLKGNSYKVSYGFMTTPERDCLIVVGVGRILGMALKGTWVYTRAREGRVYYSTDNQSGITLDVSRRWKTQLVPGADLTSLLGMHRRLMAGERVDPEAFSADDPIKDFKNLRIAYFQSLARKGLIQFERGSDNVWRYSIWGAVKSAGLNYSIGLLRDMTHGRFPRCA